MMFVAGLGPLVVYLRRRDGKRSTKLPQVVTTVQRLAIVMADATKGI